MATLRRKIGKGIGLLTELGVSVLKSHTEGSYSRFNSQHNWQGGREGGDLYDHLMSTEFFILIMKKNHIHISFGDHVESDYGRHLDLLK